MTSPVPPLPTVLDLGCGTRKLPGAFGVDAIALPGIDLVQDLDVHPWPLPDGHFRWVRAMEVLEHVEDFVACVEECHRVLRPGGRLTIKMPFAGSVHHHTDPTHRRAATSRTMDYFLEGEHLSKYGYSQAHFRLESFRYVREIPVKPPVGWLVKHLDANVLPLLERHHDIYEHYLVGWYPVHSIVFECIKDERS